MYYYSMTTINQQGPTLYVDNQTTNGTTTMSVNSNQIFNINTTNITSTYRIPSGLTANPSNDINQIGCVIYTEGSRIDVSSASIPYNMTNTGTLSIGSYILVGYCSIGPKASNTVSLTKVGIFFDTSSSVVNSATNGTAYFASANIIFGTNPYIIAGAVGNGIRISNMMIINLTTPTTIYLNCYNEYTGGGSVGGAWGLQITRIG